MSSHNSIKFHIFIANKVVGLSLDIWRSRKAFKGLLQNIYLSLLLYHKRNPLIMTVVDSSIFFFFLNIYDYNLRKIC